MRREKEKAHAPEHLDTLTCIAGLAGTYRNQGKLDEAEELEVQVMEMKIKILGPEHPDTLKALPIWQPHTGIRASFIKQRV